MTEHNVFCYSKEYDDEHSSQQGSYRAFNRVVGSGRYYEIREEVFKILEGLELELNNESWKEAWAKVTKKQWRKLLAIPEAKNFKEGFEFISEQDLSDIEENEELERAKKLLMDAGYTVRK